MKKMMISVVIPAFNAAHTIIKCLKALEKQTLLPYEVIIVDDGSRDGLEEIIIKIRPTFKIKKLFFLRQNHQGVSAARNLGAKKASGQILAFIDSDCIPGEDWLRNLVAPFSDAGVGAVGGGYSSGVDNSFWQTFSHEELSFRRRKRRGHVATLLSNNMACRKATFWKAGGFPKNYSVCEDMYLTYQISRRDKIVWLEDNGVRHHFKKNLKSFLKHQYFFGKESTRFFLENRKILVNDNHQGKQLHLAIGNSFLCLICLFTAFVLAILNKSFLGQVTLIVVGCLLITHFLLYSQFLFYLKKRNFSLFNLMRVYFISFCRDIVAAFSIFNGLALYIKRQRF